jgi:hypothetical protein
MSPPTNNWRQRRSEHNVNKARALLQTTGDKDEAVVCRRTLVLFTFMFASSLPSVVCRRALVLFTLCSLRLYLQLFVGGLMSYLLYVHFVFTSSCL